jgi:hypothetical protein
MIQSSAVRNRDLDALGYDAEEAEERMLDVMSAQINEENAALGLTVDVSSAASSDLTELLKQLANEPKDDTELSAKFTLFETFLATVTLIRDQTLQFWSDNADQFSGDARAQLQRSISSIDSHDNLGIQDDPRKWFVYSMTVKADTNAKTIARVLALIKTRLELLAMEGGECPCCFDLLNPLNVTTLSCCHKICTDCWDNWSTLKGHNVFCPLCNQRAFIEEVIV